MIKLQFKLPQTFDQLITIRIEKHNNFLKDSNKTVHVKRKTTNKTVIEENVADNSEIKKNVIICGDSIVKVAGFSRKNIDFL